MRTPAIHGFFLATLTCSGIATAQDLGALELRPFITSGLNAPLGLSVADDGSGRLFVVEKGGRIKLWHGGALAATPFLDVSTLVGTAYTEGLLDLTFHPQFVDNGRLYIKYATGNRQVHVVEYRIDADSGNIVDPASARTILIINTPQGEHNGGTLAFGPDGYLWIATGDGGGQNDPSHNGQNRANLMGKVLRINVDIAQSPSDGACGGTAGLLAYGIPADNPFVGETGVCAEIVHYGLRNPWRFSFDRDNHDLFIADVGQFAREEVNHVAADALIQPLNFGWRCYEGSLRTALACTGEPAQPPTFPVIEYPRAQGFTVIGGHRYRGRITALRGAYVFADLNRWIRLAWETGDGWSFDNWQQAPTTPVSFGEDADGELYLVLMGQNAIYRFESDDEPIVEFTVTPMAGTGGNIDPDTAQRVEQGTSITFTVTPDTGYLIDAVTGCNGALSGATYTTASVVADCTVTASFADDPDLLFRNGFEP